MQKRSRPTNVSARRAAFTLLEMMLASAIAVLLLGALYYALMAQIRHVDAGREAVEEAALVRALLNRMSSDIVASLPPYIPPPPSKAGGNAGGGSAASSGNNSSSSSGSNNSSSSSSGSSSTSSSSSSSTSPTTSSGLNGPFLFNLGLQGNSNSVMLYVSRVPRELTDPLVLNSGNIPVVPDLRRVTYWMAGSGQPLGLARQEVKMVTSSDQINTVPPDGVDEASLVIADEVRSLQFRYFDGQNWQDTWDGTTTSTTGTTGNPIGPPMAIEIRLTVAPPRSLHEARKTALDPAATTGRVYRHVVSLPMANGNMVAVPNNTTTTGTSGTTITPNTSSGVGGSSMTQLP